jgi:hypothetical protein
MTIQHTVRFLTDRGVRHQQAALQAAPAAGSSGVQDERPARWQDYENCQRV